MLMLQFGFLKMYLPVLRQNGDYKFKVIGRIKPDDEQKLAGCVGVIVTGAVDDVVVHARGALAGICSVRLAAGVQNKILEYMALGLPTVSSSTGLEGLYAKPDSEILIANSTEEYVTHILKLEKDEDFARSISENAFQYVNQHHSWSGKLKPVLDAAHELI